MGRAATEAAAAADAVVAREPAADSRRDELEAQAVAAVTADREQFVAARQLGGMGRLPWLSPGPRLSSPLLALEHVPSARKLAAASAGRARPRQS